MSKQHELELAIARVRDLHKPFMVNGFCLECSYKQDDGHYVTFIYYPCKTIKALEGNEDDN